MAEFKNSGENMKDFKGVWVFCEQRQGELPSLSWYPKAASWQTIWA